MTRFSSRLARGGAAALLAVLCAAAPAALSAQPLSNGPAGDPLAGVLGSAFPTVGQTFTAPVSANRLQNFTFYFTTQDAERPQTVNFRAYVALWDGSRASAVLYMSDEITGAALPQYTFPIGGVNLNLGVTGGVQYVAFLSTLGTNSDASAYATLVLANSNNVGGTLVFTDTPFSAPWSERGESGLAARFDAQFATVPMTAVPEPSTVLFTAAGLAGVLAAVRRRRTIA